MGFLGNLFGGEPEYGEITKTFQYNKTKEDYKNWFSKTPPWPKLESKIIDVIINRCFGNQMFEVFVHVSMQAQIIEKYDSNIKRLAQVLKEPSDEVIFSAINQELLHASASSVKRFGEIMDKGKSVSNEKELKKLMVIWVDSAESAIFIDPMYTPGYLQLALYNKLTNKPDKAKFYCLKGLEKLEEERNSPMALVMLKSEVLNYAESLKEREAGLKDLLRTL
jgi:hypothetical protein